MKTIEASLELEMAANQVRRCGEPFEIVDVQGNRLICNQERLVGVSPRATLVALAAVVKVIEHTKTLA